MTARRQSLLSALLLAACHRIAGGLEDTVKDRALIEALTRLAAQARHQVFSEVHPTDTIETLLAEAVRMGCHTALQWWTDTDPLFAYSDVQVDTLLTPRLVADVVPELLVRYHLIEDAPCATCSASSSSA